MAKTAQNAREAEEREELALKAKQNVCIHDFPIPPFFYANDIFVFWLIITHDSLSLAL